MEDNPKLIKALWMQIGFLEDSINTFWKRKKYDESIRMATTLRVVFHHTDRSHSIIDQLNWWDKEIKTTIQEPLSESLRAKMSWSDPSFFATKYGHMDPERPYIFGVKNVKDWCEQEIWLNQNICATRMQIVKWTANFLGGTHLNLDDIPASLHRFLENSVAYDQDQKKNHHSC